MFAHHFELQLELPPGALPGLLATERTLFADALIASSSTTPAASRSVASTGCPKKNGPMF